MLKKGPKIDVRPDTIDRKIILVGWLIVVINFILALGYYFQLPEIIPTRFNLKGEANGYGPKETLLIIPALSGIIYLGMTLVATKMKPHYMNFPVKVTERNAPRLYPIGIRMLVVSNLNTVIILLAIHIMILMAIVEGTDKINLEMLLGLIVVLVLVPFLYILKMFSAARE